MEPVSLGIGTAIGLLGLYSMCLEAMEQVDAGKGFEKDSSHLVARFQAEKFLFKKWGETVGIDGKSEKHRCLDESTEEYLVVRSILKSLAIMWEDSETLYFKYGLDVHDPSDLSGATGLASSKKKISLRQRFTWASTDKKHFERLLGDVGEFIQKLYNVITFEDESCKTSGMDSSLKELKQYLDGEVRERTEDRNEELAFRSRVDIYVNESSRTGFLDWVGRISTEAKFDESIRGRHPGSCTWIQSNNQFLDWFGPPYDTPATLWLHGPPGIGKTYLAASIIQYLRIHSSRRTAYFFCANEDVITNQVMSILRSWVVQLAVWSDKAVQVIRGHKPEDSLQAVPSVLLKLFCDVLESVKGCYLVLDGFDECLDAGPCYQVDARNQFLVDLHCAMRSTGTKLVIVSRNLDIIRSGLRVAEDKQALSEYAIQDEDTAEDILSLSRAIATKVCKDPDQRDKIVNHLFSRCQRMFLWVQLQGKQLRPGMNVNRIEKILQSTPGGLNQAYNRNLAEISKMPKHDRETARSILRWVLFAFRPLSVKEILHAIAAEEENATGTISDIDYEMIQANILTPCGSLIETRGGEDVHEGERTVHFVHFSAKEFLLSTEEQSRAQCIELQTQRLVPGPAFDGWTARCYKECIDKSGIRRIANNESLTPLHVACRFNLLDLCKFLLHTYNTVPRNTLNIAAWCGNESIVRLLLTVKDVDPNSAENEDFYTPLCAAVCGGHGDIVNLLLQDARVSARIGNPLFVAVYYEQLQLVPIFLTRSDVDVNAAGRRGATPLVRALLDENLAIVKLLLESRGVDVNKRSVYGWTPLHCAVSSSYTAGVTLLLDRVDVNINAKDGYGDTALKEAVMQFNEQFVKLILDRDDIDVNVLDEWGKTAIEMSSSPEIIRLLREKGGKSESELREIERAKAITPPIMEGEEHLIPPSTETDLAVKSMKPIVSEAMTTRPQETNTDNAISAPLDPSVNPSDPSITTVEVAQAKRPSLKNLTFTSSHIALCIFCLGCLYFLSFNGFFG